MLFGADEDGIIVFVKDADAISKVTIPFVLTNIFVL